MPRTRAPRRPENLDLVVRADSPAINVPATTVPKPFIVNARSIGRRKICESSCQGTSSRWAFSAVFAANAAAVNELTRITGAFSRNDLEEFVHFDFDEVDEIGIGGIDLGQDGEASLDVQQRADVEVLAGLRHHRFVGGNHQHHRIDAAHPCQHVLHEPLVTRHVDEADGRPVVEAQVGEPDVDGDAALFSSLSRSASIPVSAFTSVRSCRDRYARRFRR